MEVISSLFRIISSFLTDTLYAQSIINNLFSFDLDKKIITIKQKKKKKKFVHLMILKFIARISL